MVFDAIIVGGGPAGATAAYRLARTGARVALVDGSHPREKPCGGGVTARALQLIDASVVSIPDAVPVEVATFTFEGDVARVAFDATQPAKLGIVSRAQFDGLLLGRALQAGTSLHPTRVVSLSRLNDVWEVRTRRGLLHARWVIGADGPSSLVRKHVSRPFARADLSIASGYYVRGTSSRSIDIAFVKEPSGYLWSFPRVDHLAVGACAQADETTSSQMFALTEAWLDRHVPAGVRERYSWPIPSLRERTLQQERPSGAGWMLAGDAAGLVDPITREGIYFAIASGDAAARSLIEETDPSTRYDECLRDTIYAELVLAARLKARFYRPRFISLLISALRRSDRIRSIMADLVAGEQSYHSLRSRLLRTFEWRLMGELFGLVKVRS